MHKNSVSASFKLMSRECTVKKQHCENKAEDRCTLRAIAIIHKLQIHAPPHPALGTIHHEKSPV